MLFSVLYDAVNHGTWNLLNSSQQSEDEDPYAELFDVAVFATHVFGLDVIRGCVNICIDSYFILLNVIIFGVKKFKNAIDDDVIRTPEQNTYHQYQ